MPNNPEVDAEPPPSGSPLSPEQQSQHRQAVVANADISAQEPRARRDDMRMNMMRSVVTEPLLSRVQSALKEGRSSDMFEVIISLNETFSGGAQAAQNYVKQRAEEWGVKYSTSSHYLFACLTAEQILQLAKEVRALIRKHGPKGTVVYRIWEDNDINVSLTRSLATVKADAAQRSFQARGDNVVWAVLDSGVQGNHPHFKSDQSPFGPIDTLAVEAPVLLRKCPDETLTRGQAPRLPVVDRIPIGVFRIDRLPTPADEHRDQVVEVQSVERVVVQ